MKFLLSLEKKKKKKKLFHLLTWDYNLLPSISLLGTQLKAIFSARDDVFKSQANFIWYKGKSQILTSFSRR